MQSVFCLAYSGIFNQGTLEIHLSPGAAFVLVGLGFLSVEELNKRQQRGKGGGQLFPDPCGHRYLWVLKVEDVPMCLLTYLFPKTSAFL